MKKQNLIQQKIVAGLSSFFFIFSQFSGFYVFAEPLTAKQTEELRPVVSAAKAAINASTAPVPTLPPTSIYFESSLVKTLKPGTNKTAYRNRIASVTKQISASYSIGIGSGMNAKIYSDGTYDIAYQGKTYSSTNGEVVISNGTTTQIRLSLSVDGKNQIQKIKMSIPNSKESHLLTMESADGISKVKTYQRLSANGAVMDTIQFDNANRTVTYSDLLGTNKSFLKDGTTVADLFQIESGDLKNVYNLIRSNEAVRIGYQKNASGQLEQYSVDLPLFSKVVPQNGWDITDAAILSLKDRSLASIKSLLHGDILTRNQYVTANDGTKFYVNVMGANIEFFMIYVDRKTGRELTQKVQTMNAQGVLSFSDPSKETLVRNYTMNFDNQGKVGLFAQKALMAEYPLAIGTGMNLKLFSDTSYELTYQGKTYVSDTDGVIGSNLGLFKMKFDYGTKGPISFEYTLATVHSGGFDTQTKGVGYFEQSPSGGYQISNYYWQKIRLDTGVMLKFYEMNFNKRFSRQVDNWQGIEGQETIYETYFTTDLNSLKSKVEFGADLLSVSHQDPQRISCAEGCYSLTYGHGGVLKQFIYSPNQNEKSEMWSLLTVGGFDLRNADMLDLARSGKDSLRYLKGILRDDRLVNIGSTNASYQVITADDGTKINFPQGLNQMNQGNSTQLAFWGSATYLAKGILTQTNGLQVTLTLDQTNGTKKTYLVTIDSEGKVSLKLMAK